MNPIHFIEHSSLHVCTCTSICVYCLLWLQEGMGFCLRLNGFLIRVFIQTPILQHEQLVTDKYTVICYIFTFHCYYKIQMMKLVGWKICILCTTFTYALRNMFGWTFSHFFIVSSIALNYSWNLGHYCNSDNDISNLILLLAYMMYMYLIWPLHFL